MSTLEFVGGRERKTGSSLSSGAKAESGRLMKPWTPSAGHGQRSPWGAAPCRDSEPSGVVLAGTGLPGSGDPASCH